MEQVTITSINIDKSSLAFGSFGQLQIDRFRAMEPTEVARRGDTIMRVEEGGKAAIYGLVNDWSLNCEEMQRHFAFKDGVKVDYFIAETD